MTVKSHIFHIHGLSFNKNDQQWSNMWMMFTSQIRRQSEKFQPTLSIINQLTLNVNAILDGHETKKNKTRKKTRKMKSFVHTKNEPTGETGQGIYI